MALETAGYQVLGAVIAGLIGYGTTRLQYGWRVNREEERWFSRLDAILSRLMDFELVPKDTEDQKAWDTQAAYQRRSKETVVLLEEHLADSPVGIPDIGWERLDNIWDAVERLQNRETQGDWDEAQRLIRTARNVRMRTKEFKDLVDFDQQEFREP